MFICIRRIRIEIYAPVSTRSVAAVAMTPTAFLGPRSISVLFLRSVIPVVPVMAVVPILALLTVVPVVVVAFQQLDIVDGDVVFIRASLSPHNDVVRVARRSFVIAVVGWSWRPRISQRLQ